MPRVTKLELENTVEELKKQLDEQKNIILPYSIKTMKDIISL